MKNKKIIMISLSFLILFTVFVGGVFAQTQRITNGGFENEIVDWDSSADNINSFFSWTTTEYHSGSNSGNLTIIGVNDIQIEQNIDIDLSIFSITTFELYYKYQPIASLSVKIDTDVGVLNIATLGSESEWEQYIDVSTLNAIIEINEVTEIYSLIIIFSSSSTGTHTCYLDDISMILEYNNPTPTPEPTATPTPTPTPTATPTVTPTPTANPTYPINTQSINYINSITTNIMAIIYFIVFILIVFVIIYIWLLITRRKK